MPKALSGLMGMRHIALNVKDVERSKAFYQDILGMEVVWQPDPQNAYLSSGTDNLALHETPGDRAPVRHLVPRPPGLHRLRYRPRPGTRKRVPRQTGHHHQTLQAPPRRQRLVLLRRPRRGRHPDALRADAEPAENGRGVTSRIVHRRPNRHPGPDPGSREGEAGPELSPTYAVPEGPSGLLIKFRRMSVTASMISAGRGSRSSPNSNRTACQRGSIDSTRPNSSMIRFTRGA